MIVKDFRKNIYEDNKELFSRIELDDHKIILVGLGGSHAYGTNVEGSDIDIRGIYLNNKNELFGIDKDKEQYTSSITDTVMYSLKKAAWLLKECNPAMIEILGCREQDYFTQTQESSLLIDNLHLFLSKRATKTFGGYAKSQLNRLINLSGRSKDNILENEERSFEKDFLSLSSRYGEYIDNSAKIKRNENELLLSFAVKDMPVNKVSNILNEFNSIDREYRKSVRNDKATSHGKLSKHMMHLIRLYMMGIEIMDNQTVHTYRSGTEHELLMDIRNGLYLEDDGLTPKKEFNDMVEEYSRKYEESCKNTKLPDDPNIDGINELLIKINNRFY